MELRCTLSQRTADECEIVLDLFFYVFFTCCSLTVVRGVFPFFSPHPPPVVHEIIIDLVLVLCFLLGISILKLRITFAGEFVLFIFSYFFLLQTACLLKGKYIKSNGKLFKLFFKYLLFSYRDIHSFFFGYSIGHQTVRRTLFAKNFSLKVLKKKKV